MKRLEGSPPAGRFLCDYSCSTPLDNRGKKPTGEIKTRVGRKVFAPLNFFEFMKELPKGRKAAQLAPNHGFCGQH